MLTRARALRVAILTSLGLIPLGCFGGRLDEDAAAASADTERADATTETTQPLPDVSSCGVSIPLPAELAPYGLNGSSPVQERGIQSGIYGCENGVRHRPTPVTCESALPRPLPPGNDAGDAKLSQVRFLYPEVSALGEGCSADTDCTERPNGYCAPTFQGGVPSYNIECKYGCLQDTDCGAGFFCECGDPVGHCVAATCRSDQDCGADLLCAAWLSPVVCSGQQYYTCQTPDDECRTSADCERGYCSGGSGIRQCVPGDLGVCGRPFLVEGEARLAALSAGAGWSMGHERRPPPLVEGAASLRAQIGEHWSRAALMEHASIAAFARFTLQLLHLGAPRELIEQSQRAMLDETEHAKACFALASRYLGAAVGPGRLPMDAALGDNDLESVTLMVFLEGCVGETLATLEAQAALDGASDLDVRAALARIARDEQRHAELGWCFVRWALPLGGEHLRRKLMLELERLDAELAEPSPVAAPDVLGAHGVLSASSQAVVRRAALAEVVLPCARLLLSASRSDHATLAA